MAISKYFSDYNTSSRCIYQNGLIELRSIRMLQNFCIIEHEKYFVLRVVVHLMKIQKCNNKIKFKIIIYFTQETENCFPFHLNTENKFLMSKWRIQRTLIKHALKYSRSVEPPKFPYIALSLLEQ